jgi:hypothetical protein
MKKREKGGIFLPTAQQRAMVKLCVSFGIPHEEICKAILDHTGKPINESIFDTAFAAEIATGLLEMDMIAMTALMGQVKSGNLAAINLYMKHRSAKEPAIPPVRRLPAVKLKRLR